MRGKKKCLEKKKKKKDMKKKKKNLEGKKNWVKEMNIFNSITVTQFNQINNHFILMVEM